jgi:serine/threonine-protein phosphatase 6 regulatory subunit 3
VLENPDSKSTLVHSLSVCISLLDPKRAASVAAAGVSRGQQKIEHVHTANPETVVGMLQRLGDLLKVLDVSTDDTVLPTTYGQLHPPLGIHRLKVSVLDYSVYLIT